MKMTKKILSILLSCLMLLSMLSISVFAAAGTQSDPINANDKWFGYGVDCFLMNTTLEAGDADGVWYQLTADKAGILHIENSSTTVEYLLTVNVNGKEYRGYENGVYNKPIITLPVAVGDVISIHIIAQDTTLGGLVYCSAKFITGENNINEMVKLKGANVKIWIAADTTLYLQDDSLQAEYAAMGLKLESSVNGEGITVISASKEYTDTDGDGYIELKLAGSAGSAGVPPVKPAFAIENLSGQDAWFILNVTDSTAHECADANADTLCDSCDTALQVGCSHDYTYACDTHCSLCGELTRPEATCQSNSSFICQDGYCIYCQTSMPATGACEGIYPCSYACQYCGGVNPNKAPCTSDSYPCIDGACSLCSGFVAATTPCVGEYPCSYACKYCGGINPNKAPCTSNNPTCMDGACVDCGGFVAATTHHEYFYPCDPVCMNCYEITNPNATHTIVHEKAKEATCTATGNLEYWYCSDCGSCWIDEALTRQANRFSVILPIAEHEYFYPCDPVCMNCYEVTNPDAAHTIVHEKANDATCTATGNLEYWYCSDCGSCWIDEALTRQTNRFSVILPIAEHEYFYACDPVCMNCYEITNPDAAHAITYVPAKEASCLANGNIAFYTCDHCGGCWDNANATGMPLNRMMIVTVGDHVYSFDYDATCDVCGSERELDLPLTCGGSAISEDVNGLAVRFDIQVEGMEINGTTAIYDNATIGGMKLVSMGAIVSNNFAATQTLPTMDDVDDKHVLNVPAKYLCAFNEETGTASYAIRIINIPDDQKDTHITYIPYVIVEDDAGQQYTLYLTSQAFGGSYNNAAQ